MARNQKLMKDFEEAEVVTCNKDTTGKMEFLLLLQLVGTEYWQPSYK